MGVMTEFAREHLNCCLIKTMGAKKKAQEIGARRTPIALSQPPPVQNDSKHNGTIGKHTSQ